MSYPSLLWKKTLREAAETEESIPGSVLDDLMLTGEMKDDTLVWFRRPCGAEDIVRRQGLFRRLLESEEFRGKLGDLAEQLSELERLTGFFGRAEDPCERVMLFLPAMSRYFTLARTFAGLADEDGAAGEAGRYFAALCGREEFRAAEAELMRMMKNRRSELLYTIRGNEVSAAEGGGMLRDRLERYFRETGVPEAIPNRKALLRANDAAPAAYAEVYSGFHAVSERFYREYAAVFLEDGQDFRTVFGYSGEIRFLLDASAYFLRLREAGFPLTCPTVSERGEVVLNGIVDASLAKRGLHGGEIVPNDLLMTEDSADGKLTFYIVTGANGGGKTTFLRACGLAVLFFLAGCPVTAASARIRPFEAVYTHFPANESFENSGRFVNEANRAEEIIGKTNENTFVLFNETYSGTDERKSEEYSRRLADTMYDRGVFGMFVTHIHALTGERIPTLAAVIDEADENRRTYKIRRVGGTASSFAEDILEKYRLDRVSLAKRRKGESHDGT